MENIVDLLKKRAESIGASKLDVMTEAKLVISQQLKVEVRALSYKNGMLKIATEDASAASEIRLNKQALLNKINQKLDQEKIKDLIITIR
ncbi:MAG: DciA family protein [bacterium]|nr:DciA family protein [bacterium]